MIEYLRNMTGIDVFQTGFIILLVIVMVRNDIRIDRIHDRVVQLMECTKLADLLISIKGD